MEIKIEDLGDIDLIVVHGNIQNVYHKKFENVARIIIQEKRK